MPGLPSTRPAPDLPPGPRAALVIATSAYADPELSQLRAPARDVGALVQVLADPDVAAFTVTPLIDQPEPQIRRAIGVFLASRGTEDLVLVYLSCHGLLDNRGRLYFAATDTAKEQLAATALEAAWVLDQLDECRARRQVLILDCCFSGAFARGAKGDLGLQQRLTGQGRGRAVLTASRAREYSFEGKQLPGQAVPGSVFTAALVEGIRTGAADVNGDGYITLDEAYSYAFEHTQDSAQTPQRWLYGAEGSLVLARNPAGTAVRPARIPRALASSLDSQYPAVRIGAVTTLAGWLASEDPGQVLTAYQKLQDIADNDAPAVAAAARGHLHVSGGTSDAPRRSPPLRSSEPAAGPPPAAATELLRDEGVDQLNDKVAEQEAVTAEQTKLADEPQVKRRHPRILSRSRPRSITIMFPLRAIMFRPRAFALRLLRFLVAFGCLALLALLFAADTPTRPGAGSLEATLSDGSYDQVTDAAFSANGEYLATSDSGGSIDVWDVATRKVAYTLSDPDQSGSDPEILAFSPESDYLAVADGDNNVYLWNLAKPGASPVTITSAGLNNTPAVGLAFSPDNMTLAIATSFADSNNTSNISATYLWDVPQGMFRFRGVPLTDPDTNSCGLDSAAFSPDSPDLAAGQCDGSTYIWNASTGKVVKHLADQGGDTQSNSGIGGVAFSPNGAILAVGDSESSTYLYRMPSGAPLAALTDPGSGESVTVAFSPNGKILATGDANGSVYLWSVATHTVVATLVDPDSNLNGIETVAFSPDGMSLVTIDGNDDTELWDTAGLDMLP